MKPYLDLSRLRSGLLLGWLMAATSIFAAGEWAPPAQLQSQNSTYYPKPISDGQGGWMSCWYSFHPSTNGGSASLYTSRSTDAQSWSEPGFVHSPGYWPSLATDYKGRFLVAYQTSSHYSVGAVRTSTNFGSSWSPSTIVSGPQDGHASARQVATDGQGVWMVVGDKGTGTSSSGKYWVSVSTDNGQTWNWTDRGAGHGPGIESDRRGRWMLRWIDGAGNVKIAFSTNKGVTWSAPKTLGTMVVGNAGTGTGISQAFGRNGIWIVTWATASARPGSGSGQDIVFCRSTDDGATWSAPQVLNTNAFADSRHDYWPSLAGDGRGNWVVVWFTTEILHSCSTDDGVTWSAPQPLSTAVENRGAYPMLATDGLGTWVCHWMRYSPENNYQTFGSRMEFQAPQVTLISPRDGRCVAGNRVLIKADITPFPYSPRAGVMEFQYRPAGSPDWLTVEAAEAAHPNPDPDAPYFVHWDVSGLGEGEYELRAAARFGGTAALFSDPVTVTVSQNCGNGQELAADGTTEAWSETRSTTDTLIAAADCASSRSLEALFAADSLPDGTAVRILFPALSAPPSASEGDPAASTVSDTSLAAASSLAPVEVSFAGATQSSTPYELRLDYPDLLQDGIVDATDLPESSLRIHHLTAAGWQPLENSVVDPVRNRVSVLVSEPGRYTLDVPCSFQVSDLSQGFDSAGGTHSFNVTVTGGCSWTAVANVPWVTITSGATGTGNAAVTYTVAPNSGASREAVITVGDVLHQLSQDSPPPPSNDSFAAALLMPGASGTLTGTSVGATKEAGELNHGGEPGGASVWWYWVAPGSGPVVITTDGSSFDTLLSVYTAGNVTGLTPIATDNDSGEGQASRVMFNATRGAVYRIAVDGVDGAVGAVTLHWNMSRIPATFHGTSQSLAVSSDGPGFQVLFYNYNTGALSVSPFHPTSARVAYPQGPAEWIGLFHYDYGTQRFSQAVYRTHQGI